MFEQSLVESMKKKPPKGRLVWVVAALVLHAVALTSILVAQAWTVDPVPEPSIPVTFVQVDR